MTYLLSQLLLCLALAALFGGAIGWLAHRRRSGARLERMREAHAGVVRRLGQAESDARMLEDDFEELRRRSREEIDTLREENRALPELERNLEKSQQLMRQMRSRHEIELRELVAERDALREERARLRERLVAEGEARAELERLRARLGDAALAAPPASAAADAALAREELDALADQVIEVDDDLSAELELAGANATLPGDATAPDPARSLAGDATAPRAPSAGTNVPGDAADAAVGAEAPLGANADGAAPFARDGTDGEADDEEEPDHNATLAVEVFADLSLTAPPDADDGTTPGAEPEPPEQPLFGPVNRHDDLQRIVGIGPQTERALNALGITSYSQLAELEREEIERIADALQIFPDRIERDDWVGNARRQLEDVLEEL